MVAFLACVAVAQTAMKGECHVMKKKRKEKNGERRMSKGGGERGAKVLAGWLACAGEAGSSITFLIFLCCARIESSTFSLFSDVGSSALSLAFPGQSDHWLAGWWAGWWAGWHRNGLWAPSLFLCRLIPIRPVRWAPVPVPVRPRRSVARPLLQCLAFTPRCFAATSRPLL